MNNNEKNSTEQSRHSEHSHRHHRRRKVNKKIIYGVSAVLCAIVIFLVAFFINKAQQDEQNNTPPSSPTVPGSSETISDFSIQLPHFSTDVQIVDDIVVRCYNAKTIADIDKEIKFSYSTGNRLDKATPIKFDFNITNIPAGVIISKITVDVSENKDFSDARTFNLSGSERTVDITHLKAATKYHYRINLIPTDYYACGSFKTADTVRITNVAGVPNVRDIGNWELPDGTRIKQGLLYRGGELDGLYDPNSKITSTGITMANQVFKFKTEMDLREPTANSSNAHSVNGLNATYKCYNSPSYSDIFTDSGKNSMKNIFSDLANKDNYPVYLHCTYGFDRTGSVCFILEALLGMSYGDIEKEYTLSRLAYPNMSTDRFKELVDGLEACPGISTRKKAENYLLSAGLSQEQINSIREIFLDN